MIRSLLECEHDYINCDHSEFIGGRGAIRAVMHERGLRQAKRVGRVNSFTQVQVVMLLKLFVVLPLVRYFCMLRFARESDLLVR